MPPVYVLAYGPLSARPWQLSDSANSQTGIASCGMRRNEDAWVNKIAVIGATGMLGLPVTAKLLKAGFEVTALVRDQERARRILPEQTKVVQADIRDIASLKYGLKGQDAVYLNLSVAPTARKSDFHAEGEGVKNIIEAAHFNGLKRTGYLSAIIRDSTENDWWILDVWRNAIGQIKGSGIPYTIFYPTNFMETIAQRHVVGGFVALVGKARFANYWIAGDDYGAQVARSFQSESSANREYVIQGPEAMTYDEATVRFAKSSKDRMRVVKVPLGLLRCLGVVSRTADFHAHMMGTVLRYPEIFRAAETWAELGKPSMTIEEFTVGHQQRLSH